MKKIVFLLVVSVLSLSAYNFNTSELVWFAEDNEKCTALYTKNVNDISALYSTGNLKIIKKYILVDGVVNEFNYNSGRETYNFIVTSDLTSCKLYYKYKQYLRDRDIMLDNLQKK